MVGPVDSKKLQEAVCRGGSSFSFRTGQRPSFDKHEGEPSAVRSRSHRTWCRTASRRQLLAITPCGRSRAAPCARSRSRAVRRAAHARRPPTAAAWPLRVPPSAPSLSASSHAMDRRRTTVEPAPTSPSPAATQSRAPPTARSGPATPDVRRRRQIRALSARRPPRTDLRALACPPRAGPRAPSSARRWHQRAGLRVPLAIVRRRPPRADLCEPPWASAAPAPPHCADCSGIRPGEDGQGYISVENCGDEFPSALADATIDTED
ncbi:hypothetical protein ABZP36_026332 [Zizania latifolia]